MGKKNAGMAPVIVGLLLAGLLLLGYALSSGPAVYLSATGVIDPNTIRVVYAPLGWVEGHSAFCRDILERWATLWDPNR